ncbi:hypothetical protein B0J11DRAFT_255035 [Dendryphion nanum]|uniref:Uncharacterized protein n=1 Tax=Dendryphion nanum TaxID=256645 RepID=A0A9P9ISA4_9PLEO|nr:hypothetical protein B0J11DRAFT_255035 [Dendryphion nanum]
MKSKFQPHRTVLSTFLPFFRSTNPSPFSSIQSRCVSTQTKPDTGGIPSQTSDPSSKPSEEVIKQKKKTQAELDKELELKMKGIAGDGGESGVELEDGQPVALKRGVKNNMFRYI